MAACPCGGRRCGICGTQLWPRDAVHVDHIVPRAFRSGPINGASYRTKGDHADNLQAAHPAGNQSNGDTPNVAAWRHPSMIPVWTTEHATWRLPPLTQVTGRRSGSGHVSYATGASPHSCRASFTEGLLKPPVPASDALIQRDRRYIAMARKQQKRIFETVVVPGQVPEVSEHPDSLQSSL